MKLTALFSLISNFLGKDFLLDDDIVIISIAIHSMDKFEKLVIEGEIINIMSYINNKEKFGIKLAAGAKPPVKFSTQCSMIDGKMVGLLQGDTGTFCHLCTSTQEEDANNANIIEGGFTINKDYETCATAWEKLKGSTRSMPRTYFQNRSEILFCTALQITLT